MMPPAYLNTNRLGGAGLGTFVLEADLERPLLRNAIIWKRSSRVSRGRNSSPCRRWWDRQEANRGAGPTLRGLAGDGEVGVDLAAVLERHGVTVTVADRYRPRPGWTGVAEMPTPWRPPETL